MRERPHSAIVPAELLDHLGVPIRSVAHRHLLFGGPT
jgi:hypothetical protein